MPPHLHYCEPFFGGGAVLLEKNPEGVSEVVNDINQELTNFWRVLACPILFAEFQRLCEATPFSEWEWNNADAFDPVALPMVGRVTHAHAFFVLCRQSLAGRMKSFTSITKTRVRRGMNNEVSAWLTCVEGLPTVHTRLKRVLILDSRDAVDVIRSQDGPKTLLYCDPPYVHETRTAPDIYAHEMTLTQHDELLDVLDECQGKVMLSGYPSALYKARLEDRADGKWHYHDFDLPNQAAGGATKRRMTERIWCNFTTETHP